MGCDNSTEFSYYNSSFKVERDIRKYEVEDLMLFKKPYSSIIDQFGTSQGLDKNRTEAIFNSEYSPSILKFIEVYQKKYPSTGKICYDGEKIRNLVYLTCPDCLLKVNGKNTHDKIGYFYYQVRKEMSDDLVTPLPRQLESLDKFIGALYDIACIDLVKHLCQVKNVDPSSNDFNLTLAKEKTIENYKDYIFTMNGRVQDTFTYENFEKKFAENPMIFTTGHLREFAWKAKSLLHN